MNAPDEFSRALLRWAARPGAEEADEAAATVVARLTGEPAARRRAQIDRWALAATATAALALAVLFAERGAAPRPATTAAPLRSELDRRSASGSIGTSTTLVVPLRSGAKLYVVLRPQAEAAAVGRSIFDRSTLEEKP